MTVNSTFNFELDDTDLARFEQNNQTFDLIGQWMELGADQKSRNVRGTRNNEFLGSPDKPRGRAGQELK